MMKNWWIAAAVVLGCASKSQAHILFDPYVGYEMGSGKNGEASISTKSINLGARLGWLSESLKYIIALDYNSLMDGSVDFDETNRVAYNKSAIMAVFGYNFQNNPYRIYAGFGTDEWTVKDDNATKLTGTAYKVGLGYTRYKPVTLNFEYMVETFKKATDSTGDFDTDVSNNAMMFIVSWPMKF